MSMTVLGFKPTIYDPQFECFTSEHTLKQSMTRTLLVLNSSINKSNSEIFFNYIIIPGKLPLLSFYFGTRRLGPRARCLRYQEYCY